MLNLLIQKLLFCLACCNRCLFDILLIIWGGLLWMIVYWLLLWFLWNRVLLEEPIVLIRKTFWVVNPFLLRITSALCLNHSLFELLSGLLMIIKLLDEVIHAHACLYRVLLLLLRITERLSARGNVKSTDFWTLVALVCL